MTVSVNPLLKNSGLTLLRRMGALSMAFLPAGFDEQLVLDSIEYGVERVFFTVVRIVDYCLRSIERIIGF